MITGNEGGGYFSNEIVPFPNVTDSLKGIKAGSPFCGLGFQGCAPGQEREQQQPTAASWPGFRVQKV